MECAIQRVDQDNRVLIPQSALKHVIWIAGSEPLKAWLLVGSPGRCRLLSNAEFEEDAGCQSLKASIEAEETRPAASIMEFRDDALVALGLRLVPVEIAPPGPGWRLTLPRALTAIMQIRPKESSVAVLLRQAHIEIWTLDTLRASVGVPLVELV